MADRELIIEELKKISGLDDWLVDMAMDPERELDTESVVYQYTKDVESFRHGVIFTLLSLRKMVTQS